MSDFKRAGCWERDLVIQIIHIPRGSSVAVRYHETMSMCPVIVNIISSIKRLQEQCFETRVSCLRCLSLLSLGGGGGSDCSKEM